MNFDHFPLNRRALRLATTVGALATAPVLQAQATWYSPAPEVAPGPLGRLFFTPEQRQANRHSKTKTQPSPTAQAAASGGGNAGKQEPMVVRGWVQRTRGNSSLFVNSSVIYESAAPLNPTPEESFFIDWSTPPFLSPPSLHLPSSPVSSDPVTPGRQGADFATLKRSEAHRQP